MSLMDHIKRLKAPDRPPEPFPEDLDILERAVEGWAALYPTPNVIPFTVFLADNDVRRIECDNLTTAIREVFKLTEPACVKAQSTFKIQIGKGTPMEVPLSILLEVFSAEELSIYGFDLHHLLEIKSEPTRYLSGA